MLRSILKTKNSLLLALFWITMGGGVSASLMGTSAPIAASQPVESQLGPDFITILKDLGPWVAIAIFFIWNGQRDKDALIKQIQESDLFIRTQLMTVLTANTAAMESITEVIRRCPNATKMPAVQT